MDALDGRACIDECTERMIKIAARKLTHGSLFLPSEREDIEQELRLDCLKRLPRFVDSRGLRRAFVRRIIDNRISNLCENRSAARRDPRREAFSLDDCPRADDSQGETYGELLGPAQCDLSVRESCARNHELRVDIARLLCGLPPSMADLCRRLAYQSVTEISRTTGIPRGTLYEHIKRIRQVARASGLYAYLESRHFSIRSGTRSKSRRRTP